MKNIKYLVMFSFMTILSCSSNDYEDLNSNTTTPFTSALGAAQLPEKPNHVGYLVKQPDNFSKINYINITVSNINVNKDISLSGDTTSTWILNDQGFYLATIPIINLPAKGEWYISEVIITDKTGNTQSIKLTGKSDKIYIAITLD